jgi:hypothetical protein
MDTTMQTLIRILLIWILLFGIAEARTCNVVVGGLPVTSGGAGGCETGTATVIAYDDDVDEGNTRDFNTYAIGQSFTVSTAEPFYSVQIFAGGASGTVTCRIGTTTDLSSTYVDEVSISVSAAYTWYEGVSSSCPNLSTGTMYVICSTASDLNINWNIDDSSAEYAGGTYYYGSGHGFVAADAVTTRDTLFKISSRH